MEPTPLIQRYQQLQSYAQWTDADVARVLAVGRIVSPQLPALIDDFCAVLQEHPVPYAVITGGAPQLASLRQSLAAWFQELFAGVYDERYIERRLRAGRRHVTIELDQACMNVAMSRLRSALIDLLRARWTGTPAELLDAIGSLNKLLDLDLAIIDEAYESEHVRREKVAERSRMRSIIHQEKALSEGLWEHAQAIILVLDIHGGIIRYNPYLARLTGVPCRAAKGWNWFDRFVPEGERERQRAIFAETAQRDTSAAISGLLTCAGRERRISWSTKSLQNMAGRTVAILVVGQDITELNQAQQRALQAERLAGIGQMITGLAHESRNALQRIQACAEMLELAVEGQAEALDLVRRIKLAQDHIHRLFDEVRSYAAPVTLDRAACQLGSVWREAWELLLPQWEGRIAEIIDRTAGMDLRCEGDHFHLVQLFRILFENALAACPDPVRIEIACRPASAAESIHLSVRDNGPGLSPQQRAQMFEPFYTTKTKGTGLGLAIAQRIVEAHGGQITAGAAAAHGAEILVTLPRTPPA